MSIAKYISELLFDYECVVLPGLGGFITNQRSATINRFTHQFNPPYSQIFFNKHLTANDGLLINYIALSEKVSYEIVSNQVNVFVKSVKLRLEAGEKVLLENIGTLEYDEKKNIQFEQFSEINFNTSSFGLSSLISPSIRRKTDEERIKDLILAGSSRSRKPSERKDRKQSPSKKRGFVKSTVTIAMLALFVLSLSWGLVEREQVAEFWQEQASFFPFNNSTPKYHPRSESKTFQKIDLTKNEIPVSTSETDLSETKANKTEEFLAEETDLSKTPSEADFTTKKEAVDPITSPDSKSTSVVAKEKIIVPKTKLYYVVAGSFSKEVNANKLVATLRQKGYNALIADTTKSGMFRVAYLSAHDLANAKEQLYAIRQDDNPDAWIFRK